MSVTALRPEAPLQLLHPLWCVEGPPHADDAAHRSAATCWEAGDVRFTLNRVRWDEPRYLNGQRQRVDGRGGPAPEPGAEHIEMTLTSIALVRPDSSPVEVDVSLGVGEFEMWIALQQQQCDRAKGSSLRDQPRED